MFIHHPFCFQPLERHLNFSSVHLFVPLGFHHWDNILGSICAHSFFVFVTNYSLGHEPLVSLSLDTILV